MRVARAIRDYALANQSKQGKRLIVRLLGLGEPNPKYFPGSTAQDGPAMSDYSTLAWEVRDQADLDYEAARVFHLPNVGGRQQPVSPEAFRQLLATGVAYGGKWLEIKQPDVWDTRTNAPYAPYAEALAEAARSMSGSGHSLP